MTEEVNVNAVISELDRLFKEHNLNEINDRMLLTRCLNESWFSDTLAWLLDPKGSHGLKDKFAKAFIKEVSKRRCSEDKKRFSYLLNFGKGGAGKRVNDFKIDNASVIREYYFTDENKGKSRTCDIVFLDLDTDDSLYILIENKLFSRNTRNQLENYKAIARETLNTKSCEFVYLTVDGSKPKQKKDEKIQDFLFWVELSWIDDVKNILEKFVDGKNQVVNDFHTLLSWMSSTRDILIKNHRLINETKKEIIKRSTIALVEELNRLASNCNWECSINDYCSNIKLKDSDTDKGKELTKKTIHIDILSSLNTTITVKTKKSTLYKRTLIPLGFNSDQIKNNIDISARNIYNTLTDSQKIKYRSGARKIKSAKLSSNDIDFFEFISEHKDIISFLQKLYMYIKDSIEISEEFVENNFVEKAKKSLEEWDEKFEKLKELARESGFDV